MRDDHADRPRETGRLGKDGVGLVTDGHRHVIAAAGRDASHADDDGNLLLSSPVAEVMVKIIAAADAAAGAIDAEHHGLDVLVFHGRVDRPLDEAVLALQDDALDRQDDDLVLRRSGRARRTSPAPAAVPSPSRLALRAEQNEIQEERPAKHHHEQGEEQPPPESPAGGRRRRIVRARRGSRLGRNGRLRWRCPFGMGGGRHGIPRGPSVVCYAFYGSVAIKQCPQIRRAGIDACSTLSADSPFYRVFRASSNAPAT